MYKRGDVVYNGCIAAGISRSKKKYEQTGRKFIYLAPVLDFRLQTGFLSTNTRYPACLQKAQTFRPSLDSTSIYKYNGGVSKSN